MQRNGKGNQLGFTLIELMIVVAIISILASLAIPAYELYRNRSRFSEAVLAVSDHKSSILIAAQKDRFNTVDDIDAGAFGVSLNQAQAPSTHGISVIDGVITVVWKADGTDLAGTTFTMTAQGVVPPIEWVQAGSCKIQGYC